MSDVSRDTQLVKRSVGRAVGVVLVLGGAFMVLPLRGERWWLGACLGAVLLGATIPLAVHRVRKVLGSERPVVEAFEALVQLLAMLVTGFGAVLYALNRDGDQMAGLDTRLDAIYFTVTTLSTVGFGDIHASSQAARAIVTIQILFNLLFVGVAVRVFITAARRRTVEKSATDV